MKNVSMNEVLLAANKVAQLLTDRYHTRTYVTLYGVPRGGISAVLAIGTQRDNHLIPIRITDKPENADVIIDDLIDSGRTMENFNLRFPEKPFIALFTKTDSSEWLVFPWEKISSGNTSADDIPVRLLQYIGEETTRGGLKETPTRFLKAWKHFTSGYDKDPKEVMKVFADGAESYNEMVLVKSIPVYSQCEHHLVPFFGVAHVAYIPNGKIVGLSKLSRVVDIFARRLQVQERLTSQVAECLNTELNPLGVAVVLECRHLCMESRGISQQGHITITSAMLGAFKDKADTRAEFMGLIKS